MFSGVDGAATPKEETRKRNAPKHDPLAPDHKRSFSTATVEVFHARDVEVSDVIVDVNLCEVIVDHSHLLPCY